MGGVVYGGDGIDGIGLGGLGKGSGSGETVKEIEEGEGTLMERRKKKEVREVLRVESIGLTRWDWS